MTFDSEKRLITAEQLQRFGADGYFVLEDFVSASDISDLARDADTVLESTIRSMAETRTNDKRITWWRLASGRPYVLKVKPVIERAPAARALASGPKMRELASALLGAEAELMEDKFMYKKELDTDAAWAQLPVLGEEVRKHTDAAYFRARGFQKVLTVAICLDDCTQASGALKVWPVTHDREIAFQQTERQGPIVPDDVAPDHLAVTLTARSGSVLAWDSALVHASDPNVSVKPRRLLVLGYAPQQGH
ncbi:phytanoyl-CoA dioxygenase family protein [Promicromonospora sp. CA-289599]|uniref:phytanoyl-CoA dioxygenase family protein n=1 Tax=Promicromonospora sp. CA-289599 TaxID=3240014 RepID=UPI003D8E725E